MAFVRLEAAGDIYVSPSRFTKKELKTIIVIYSRSTKTGATVVDEKKKIWASGGGGEWRVPRSVFSVFSETFLTGTYVCIFGWQMCQGPFWTKPSTDN